MELHSILMSGTVWIVIYIKKQNKKEHIIDVVRNYWDQNGVHAYNIWLYPLSIASLNVIAFKI